MSFPNLIFGNYGDEKTQSSTKIGNLPLGQRMILPDGRVFAHAKAGGTILVRGKLTMSEDTEDGHDDSLELPSSVGAGDTTFTVTMAGTVITKNQYEDGYLTVNADTAGGEMYKIRGNSPAASVTAATIELYPGDGIVTAWGSATTEVGLRTNEFTGLLLFKARTCVGIPAGIPTMEIAANRYFWVQRRGVAGCYVGGSHVLGESLVASTADDGALMPWAGSTAATVSWENEKLAYSHTVQASTEYGLCYLTLD